MQRLKEVFFFPFYCFLKISNLINGSALTLKSIHTFLASRFNNGLVKSFLSCPFSPGGREGRDPSVQIP